MGNPATEQKPLQPKHFAEAPCSANVRARIGGYDWQITCRSHVDGDDLINMAKAIKWWNAWLDGNKAQSPVVAAEAINVETPHAPDELPTISAEMPTTQHPTQSAELSFHADKLTVTVSEGKKYIKAKGGQFTQYGVSIWPEVLKAAGIDADKLDPMKGEYPLNMTAVYVLNDKGKPSKIVRLIK